MRTPLPNMQALSGRAGRISGLLGALLIWALAACAYQPPAPPPSPAPAAPPRAWSQSALLDLRAAAEAAPLHGLAPESDPLGRLALLDAASRTDAAAATALDTAADAMFVRLAVAYSTGATDAAVADPTWSIPRATAPDGDALLLQARKSAHAKAILEALLPTNSDYVALERELTAVLNEAPGTPDANGLIREQRLERLRASLERERWLSRALPERRIEVLTPFFLARLHGPSPSARHRVIVGTRGMPTPSFAAAIETITINPSWSPPASIVARELAPRFRRNPGAAASEGFQVFDAQGRLVDPAAVNWGARPLGYVLRQRPGPGNALGRIRFDMPNAFSIYMHDTPSKQLFNRADRALSHGCIRVDEPVSLAADVLNDPAWSAEAITAAIDQGGTQTITLTEPMPVFVLYLTAAPDEGGVVRYADDLYHRDAAVLRLLDGPTAVSQRLDRTAPCGA